MNTQVKNHGEILALRGVAFGDNGGELPLNPRIGTVVQNGNNLLAWVEIDGVRLWYPLVKGADTNTYLHTQGVSNISWTIEHGLGTQDFVLSIKDQDGDEILTYQSLEYDSVDPNNKVVITFAEPINGKAFLVATRSLSTPELNASVIKIGADLTLNSAGITFKGTLLDLNKLSNVDSQLATVSTKADTATTAAVSALSRANSAITTADAASLAVGTLTTQVNQAQTQASNAVTASSQATTVANKAKTDAAAALAAVTAVPYDFGFASDDALTAGLLVGRINLVRKCSVPVNFAGSIFTLATAPLGAVTFKLRANDADVGTLIFNAGFKTPSSITFPATVFNAGTELELVCMTADTTGKGFDGTVLANLVV